MLKNRRNLLPQEFFGLSRSAAYEVFRFHQRKQLFFCHIECRIGGNPIEKVIFQAFLFDPLAGGHGVRIRSCSS